MAKKVSTKKVCSKGHTFYKSSDCPVCPICWNSKNKEKSAGVFPKTLSAPALRALSNAKITTLKKLATYTESEILKLHGIGPSSMPKLREALKNQGLKFSVEHESKSRPLTVAAYIKAFPKDIQSVLRKVRQTIKKNAPQAEEGIAYGMAGYKIAGKPLVYFAGYSSHVGFYATPTGHAAFKKELSKYKQGKGSVQFPLTEPMPLALISRIVRFRVKENRDKSKE